MSMSRSHETTFEQDKVEAVRHIAEALVLLEYEAHVTHVGIQGIDGRDLDSAISAGGIPALLVGELSVFRYESRAPFDLLLANPEQRHAFFGRTHPLIAVFAWAFVESHWDLILHLSGLLSLTGPLSVEELVEQVSLRPPRRWSTCIRDGMELASLALVIGR